MLGKVWNFCQQHHMLQEKDRVIAGVSGGADSVCLLFVLSQLRKCCDFSLYVVHVHHGIRGAEADEDAEFVQKLCEKMEVPFALYRYNVPELAVKTSCSIEEAGRNARYEAFEQACQKWHANKVALAHHMDDQAETMLFHLFRGTGLKGLGGIPIVRDQIIRPLLCLERADIEQMLCKQGMTWREDATNQEDAYSRNKIRNHVLSYVKKELSPHASASMMRTAEQLRQVEQYMEQTARQLLAVKKDCDGGVLRVEVETIKCQPEIMQTYMIRECFCIQGWGLRDLTSTHIESVRSLLEKQSGRRVMLPGGYVVRREFSELLFETQERLLLPACRQEELDVELRFSVEDAKNIQEIPNLRYTKWFDYDKIKCLLQVRTRRPGDRIQTLANGGGTTIKEYMIAEKIPADARDHIALLADGQEIMWVVGYRISEAYKVTAATTRVLRVDAIDV